MLSIADPCLGYLNSVLVEKELLSTLFNKIITGENPVYLLVNRVNDCLGSLVRFPRIPVRVQWRLLKGVSFNGRKRLFQRLLAFIRFRDIDVIQLGNNVRLCTWQSQWRSPIGL